jgi:hypothetical protein
LDLVMALGCRVVRTIASMRWLAIAGVVISACAPPVAALGSSSPVPISSTAVIVPSRCVSLKASVLAGSLIDLDGDGVPDCLVADARPGMFLSFLSGADGRTIDLGEVAMGTSLPQVTIYHPTGELPIAVVTGALGADAGQALVYQWRAQTLGLLLQVGGHRIEQSDEGGRPVIRTISGGLGMTPITTVYGWNGIAYAAR